MISHVDTAKCSGCGTCVNICPYQAISLQTKKFRENSVKVERQVRGKRGAVPRLRRLHRGVPSRRP
jgi:Fe-S-cluster-containing hydrogenase component 2